MTTAFEPLAAIDLEAGERATEMAGPNTAAFDGPAVAARTDSELARAFLYANALAPHSLKSTRKDLGRFLLWCQTQHKKLIQLRIEDLLAYKAFLLDPQPAQRWISRTKWPRSDGRWRPFSGPLAPVSANHAFRVVKALLEFAKDTGYLQRNAGALSKAQYRAPFLGARAQGQTRGVGGVDQGTIGTLNAGSDCAEPINRAASAVGEQAQSQQRAPPAPACPAAGYRASHLNCLSRRCRSDLEC